MRRRAGAVMMAAMVGAVMVPAAVAWACTDFIGIQAVSPSVTQPETATAVRGVNAVAGSVVDLRWNRVDGPVLAQANADASGAFAAEVQVPNVTPGIYVITATSQGHVARAAVQVGVGAVVDQPVVSGSSSGPGRDAGMTVVAGGLVLLASAAVLMSARRRRVRSVGPVGRTSGTSSADRLDDLVELGR